MAKIEKNILISVIASTKTIMIALILLSVLTYGFAKEYVRKTQVRSEIEQLQAQVVALQSQNTNQMKVLKYFQSEGYVENEARLNLGLKKKSESVIIFPGIQEVGRASVPAQDMPKENDVPLPQKWFAYFFPEMVYILQSGFF